MIELVLLLVVIGVMLWVLNTYGGPYIAAPILKIINAVVIVAVIFYVLAAFGLLPVDLPLPRFRR